MFTRILRFLLCAAGGSTALACGPEFPNTYLANSIDEITTLPTLSFARELARVRGHPRAPSAPGEAESLLAAERSEIRSALVATGLSPAKVDVAVAAYRRDALPSALPREFHVYAIGAAAWHEGRTNDALAAWQELLQMPPGERRYRTVWAAYMIGRMLCDTDPGAALRACDLAQSSADEGYADSQGLAAVSRGWAARACLRQGDYGGALRRYLQQFDAGVPTAIGSLQLTLLRAFRGEDAAWRYAAGAAVPTPVGARRDPADADGAKRAEDTQASDWTLEELAADPELRAVVAAWFVARGGPALTWRADRADDFARFVRHVRGQGNLTAAEADRWAWAAYQNGCYTDARQLVQRAPAEAPASEWVRAMLLLRAGFVDEAAVHLARAARAFDTDRAIAGISDPQPEGAGYGELEGQPFRDSPGRQLGGVRGVLALRQDRYTEAVRLFLETDHWTDAAYVAERVLTLRELIAFVRAECPAPGAAQPQRAWHRALPHLLARRLVRAGRFEEAKEFMPPEFRDSYQSYVEGVRIGFDAQQPATDRASGLWAAARVLREHGMELAGTELEPDGASESGEYPPLELVRRRLGERPSAAAAAPAPSLEDPDLLLATAGERARLDESVVPKRRFHYRWRAAELGLLAASLLPNDDARAAEILNEAGGWIADHDPEGAKVFYRTLALRCPNTALGRRVLESRWLIPASKLPPH